MKKFKIKSFCKINLSLKVLKKLKNDHHKISSLITFCGPHDDMTITVTKDQKDNISFTGKFKKGINKKKNTITKLLYLLRKKGFFRNKKFKINIKKNVPHGSGLGGGSSNAANLLNFFNSKMKLKLNKNKLYKIANEVGFDVPIGLEKKNTLLTGKKGEILRFNRKFNFNILIVYPNLISSTKEIYEKNKKFSSYKSQSKINTFNQRQLINFLKQESNDLEKTVIKLHSKVRNIIDFMKIQNGCYFSRITGSGSACIGIFCNKKDAAYTQKMIKLKYPNYWCVVSKTI